MNGIAHVVQAQVPAFLAYCAAHRFDHDESFLDERSLCPVPARPRGKGSDPRRRGRRGSGEQHHSCSSATRPGKWGERASESFTRSLNRVDDYRALFEALLPVDKGFPLSYLFLSDKAAATERIVRDMGFFIDRRSWLLGRPLGESLDPRIPPGLLLVPCEPVPRQACR